MMTPPVPSAAGLLPSEFEGAAVATGREDHDYDTDDSTSRYVKSCLGSSAAAATSQVLFFFSWDRNGEELRLENGVFRPPLYRQRYDYVINKLSKPKWEKQIRKVSSANFSLDSTVALPLK